MEYCIPEWQSSVSFKRTLQIYGNWCGAEIKPKAPVGANPSDSEWGFEQEWWWRHTGLNRLPEAKRHELKPATSGPGVERCWFGRLHCKFPQVCRCVVL